MSSSEFYGQGVCGWYSSRRLQSCTVFYKFNILKTDKSDTIIYTSCVKDGNTYTNFEITLGTIDSGITVEASSSTDAVAKLKQMGVLRPLKESDLVGLSYKVLTECMMLCDEQGRYVVLQYLLSFFEDKTVIRSPIPIDCFDTKSCVCGRKDLDKLWKFCPTCGLPLDFNFVSKRKFWQKQTEAGL